MQTIPTSGTASSPLKSVARSAHSASRITAWCTSVLLVVLAPLVVWRVATHDSSASTDTAGGYAKAVTRAWVTWDFDRYVQLLVPELDTASRASAAYTMREQSKVDGTPAPLPDPGVEVVSVTHEQEGAVVLVRVTAPGTVDTWRWSLVRLRGHWTVAEYDKNPGGEHVPTP